MEAQLRLQGQLQSDRFFVQSGTKQNFVSWAEAKCCGDIQSAIAVQRGGTWVFLGHIAQNILRLLSWKCKFEPIQAPIRIAGPNWGKISHTCSGRTTLKHGSTLYSSPISWLCLQPTEVTHEGRPRASRCEYPGRQILAGHQKKLVESENSELPLSQARR